MLRPLSPLDPVLAIVKHIPSAIFFLCLCTVVINMSLDARMDVFLLALGIGTAAMVVQHLMEKQAAKAKAPDRAQQLAHWQAQRTHVEANLRQARQAPADDRVPFLESQLAEAERQLKKLGAG